MAEDTTTEDTSTSPSASSGQGSAQATENEIFAIIPTGGKQYVVHEGDEMDVEKLDAEEGEEVEFEAVLMTGEGDDVDVGDPEVDATVVGEVVEHGKGEKIEVMKFKRKNNYKRVRGHRQPYTTVEITQISS